MAEMIFKGQSSYRLAYGVVLQRILNKKA